MQRGGRRYLPILRRWVRLSGRLAPVERVLVLGGLAAAVVRLLEETHGAVVVGRHRERIVAILARTAVEELRREAAEGGETTECAADAGQGPRRWRQKAE